MRKGIFFLLLISICIITSCATQKATSSSSINVDTIYLFQNDEEISISKNSEQVSIKKDAFSLRFYNKKYNVNTKEFYAVQIASFLDKQALDNIEVGMSKNDTHNFSLGTGMAPSISGKYESLMFQEYASHHYLMYTDAKSKRLNLLDTYGDYLKLEFEVNTLQYKGKQVHMSETDLTEFYLVILIDRNLNGYIDEGELTKLKVKIKQ